MTAVGSIVGGLLLTILAGICNGTYNAAFLPKFNLAVGRGPRLSNSIQTSASSFTDHPDFREHVDLKFHHAFALFQFYAALINIPICVGWIGGFGRVHDILSQASTTSIVIVIVCAVIWGIGTAYITVACKVAGHGLGTNLTMAVIIILGTLVPLVVYSTWGAYGGVVLTGVAIYCIALVLVTKSLIMKDADENNYQDNLIKKEANSTSDEKLPSETIKTQDKLSTVNEDVDIIINLDDKNYYEKRNVTFADEAPIEGSSSRNRSKFAPRQSVYGFMMEDINDLLDDLEDETDNEKKEVLADEVVHHSVFKKIGVCVFAGVTCSALQFGFIYGDDIRVITRSYPDYVPGSDTLVFWLLSVSFGSAPFSIAKGLYSSQDPISVIWKAPWYRHVLIILCTSLPWLAHIHLYGLVNSLLLPKNVAASIAWPLLMMTATLSALVLSILFKEWKHATRKTKNVLLASVIIGVIGLSVIMGSVGFHVNDSDVDHDHR